LRLALQAERQQSCLARATTLCTYPGLARYGPRYRCPGLVPVTIPGARQMAEEVLAAAAVPSRVPYAAAGDLAYGGRLHGLMAGGIFAGSIQLRGACLAEAGGLALPTRCKNGLLTAELYYHDAGTLASIAYRLEQLLGAQRETLEAVHGDTVFPVEVHIVQGAPARRQPTWLRILLLLPPLAPPPAQPLATYTVEASGVEPCMDGRLFCHGNGREAVVADVVVSPERLNAWLSELGAVLTPLIARSLSTGLYLYVHAPLLQEEPIGSTAPS